MQQEKEITIAIVSQQDLFRQGLTVLIEAIGYHPQSILSASAVEKVLEGPLTPNILLLHTGLKETGETLEVISSFKAQIPAVHLLAILSSFDDELLRQLKQSKASGYLFEDAEPSEFKRAVEKVMKGEKYYQPRHTMQGYYYDLPEQIRSILCR